MSKSSETLRKLVKAKMSKESRLTGLMLDASKIPPSILPKYTSKIFNIMDVDPLETARQICLIEQEKFRAIQPRECLNQSWNSKKDKAPNICFLINHFNDLSRYITTAIVKQTKLSHRRKLIEKFIVIGLKCQLLNNFNAIMEIVAGLEDSSVHRLYKTWETVNVNLRQGYESLKELMSSHLNFKNFRATLHTVDPPCIPYVGVYLTDLTFIEDGMQDNIHNSAGPSIINFAKRRKIAVVIREIQQYQHTPYALLPMPNLQKYLVHVSGLPAAECYKLSLFVEPRDKRPLE